jgi:hypothetical protein
MVIYIQSRATDSPFLDWKIYARAAASVEKNQNVVVIQSIGRLEYVS